MCPKQFQKFLLAPTIKKHWPKRENVFFIGSWFQCDRLFKKAFKCEKHNRRYDVPIMLSNLEGL